MRYLSRMFKRPKPRRKGVIPEHLRQRFAYLDGLPVSEPPAPWERLPAIAVGGLWQVGFAPGSDLLLLLSSSGRGVVDCLSGERLARDDGDYYADGPSLEAEGIGPLEGHLIAIAGPSGGALTRVTHDGWGIELHPLSWPEEELFVCPPGETMLWQRPGAESALVKVRPLPSALVAYGFSPTGRSLVIATSSDLEIYRRA